MRLIKKSGFILFIVLFNSCYNAEYLEQPDLNFDWNPEIAIPLLEKTLTLDSWVGGLPFEDLPFEFLQLLGNIELQDTIPMNLKNFNSSEVSINKVNFNFYMVNGYGAIVSGQAYFVRGNYSLIDSVFSDGPVELPAAHIGTATDIWVPFPILEQTEYDIEAFQTITEESQFIIVKYGIDISELEESDLAFLPGQSIVVNLGVKIDLIQNITAK